MSLPALKSGGAIAPIIPTTFEDVQRVANIIHASGLAPRDLGTAEKVATVILLGMEIGLPPMFSMQNIAVINGRPTIWGKAIPALLHRAGFKIEETADENGARCKITRPGGQEFVRTFTRKDAIDAGLWNKAGPWKQYPVRMMQMRARGFCAADAAADVLGGLYLSEELQGGELRDADAAPQIAPPDEPELPPDDEPARPSVDMSAQNWRDPVTFVEYYRNEMTLMPPDERQEFCDANATSIEMLPQEFIDEIDAINRELMP